MIGDFKKSGVQKCPDVFNEQQSNIEYVKYVSRKNSKSAKGGKNT